MAMKILLIGNFAPPYEEENLHNLSLLKKLEEDGNACSVINISQNPSVDGRFTDAKNLPGFLLVLCRLAWKKDVIHFFTKGYLRLGLLNLMFAVLVGTILRAKTFITIHSELFSMQGQMRSPVGGRQTVFTAFTVATKVICSDQDTFDVAAMYMKRDNFQLIPTFIYIPHEISGRESDLAEKIKNKDTIIVFSNVHCPSFLFDVLKELISSNSLPPDTAIVITFNTMETEHLQSNIIDEAGGKMRDNIIVIAQNDADLTLLAYSRARLILRPLSCEGTTLFEPFAISVKKTFHMNSDVYFPSGMLFVKEGMAAELCVCLINTMLSAEAGSLPEFETRDSYMQIRQLYEE
jgi:hypothetical protein